MIGYVRVRADKGRSFCLLIFLLFPLKKITYLSLLRSHGNWTFAFVFFFLSFFGEGSEGRLKMINCYSGFYCSQIFLHFP